MKIRGVGFDLGETLLFYRDTPLNWLALYPDALRAVATACAASPTPEQIAAAGEILAHYNTRLVPRTQEVTAEEIWPLILNAWGLDTVRHLSPAMEAFFTFFQQNMIPYPETIRVLTSLRERGIPVGILTDVPYGMPRHFVQRDLDGAGLAGLFDVMLTSVEVGVRKPEPAGYLALASRLGLAPSEMLYVGNEPKDVIGACRAGFIAAFLDRVGNGGNHGQQFTIATLAEVDEIMAASHRE